MTVLNTAIDVLILCGVGLLGALVGVAIALVCVLVLDMGSSVFRRCEQKMERESAGGNGQ
jgi:hypothetical protein